MRDNAERRDEETPEITTTASLEGDETQDYQFNGIVPGDSSKSSEYMGSHLIPRTDPVYQRLRDLGGSIRRHRRKHIAHGEFNALIDRTGVYSVDVEGEGEKGILKIGGNLKKKKKEKEKGIVQSDRSSVADQGSFLLQRFLVVGIARGPGERITSPRGDDYLQILFRVQGPSVVRDESPMN